MSKCKFKNLILSRQIWSFCPWLPGKLVNYHAFASLCFQLLKHFIFLLLFCLKLVFVEKAGLTALASEIVCLPTEYVLPRQWQSKLPHAVLSMCYNLYWGEWRWEETEEEVGCFSHQAFATKTCKHCQKKKYFYFPSSTESSAGKNWMNSGSGNLYPVCKSQSRSQHCSCCYVAVGTGDRWSHELSRVFLAQSQGKRVFREL